LYEGEFDPTDYPIALDKLVGTEFALKVKAQPTFKMVSLLNYKTDPDIIQHIKDQIPNLEVIFTYLLLYELMNLCD
jgi:hypothetical protein